MKWFKQSWKDSSFKWTTIALLGGSVLWDSIITMMDYFYYNKGFTVHFMTTAIFWSIYFLAVLPWTYISYRKKIKRGIL